VWRHRPRLGWLIGATAPVTNAATRTVAVGLELMPKRGTGLPKHPDTARQRSRRQRRAITVLAALLLLVATGVGALAYRDYESGRAQRDYQVAILAAEDSLTSAHNLVNRRPPDPDGARTRVSQARAKIDEAGRYARADRARLAALTADADALIDKLDGVILDLAHIAPGAKPSQIVGNANGLYLADPGSGRLWRVFGDPVQNGVVLQRGQKGVAAPSLVSWQADALYVLDDARRLWLAEGDQVNDVTPSGIAAWKSTTAIAVFTLNLYVLDTASGQLWKHESNDGVSFGGATPYLAAPLAANTARSLAVDGDVWIVTSASEIMRFRRNPLVTTAGRVDFTPRWQGEPPHPTAIQAVASQTNIYVLDAVGRTIVQLARDGRELLRIPLSTTLG